MTRVGSQRRSKKSNRSINSILRFSSPLRQKAAYSLSPDLENTVKKIKPFIRLCPVYKQFGLQM